MWKDEAEEKEAEKPIYFIFAIRYIFLQCHRCRRRCCAVGCYIVAAFFHFEHWLLRVLFSFTFFCSTWICYSANWNTCRNGMFLIFLVVLCALAVRKRQLYLGSGLGVLVILITLQLESVLYSVHYIHTHVDYSLYLWNHKIPQNDTTSQFAWLNFPVKMWAFNIHLYNILTV